jgi:carboxypeptidase Taq
MNDRLERLRAIDRQVHLLGHTAAVLHWDQETYMPAQAVDERAEQLALLQGLIHDRTTDPAVGDFLGELGVPESEQEVEQAASLRALNTVDRAFLREIRRSFRRNTQIPRRLVIELARQTAVGQQLWATARREANFPMFAGQLKTIVSLMREMASCLGYVDHPYDPLLDEYEPFTGTAEVTKVFDGLQQGLKELLQRIRTSRRPVETAFLSRQYDVARQREFSLEVLQALGYDFQRGRFDESAHPFTSTLGRADVRVTTRFNPSFFNSGIFGTIHEAGHALYELGLDETLRGGILGDGASLGIHESQSRMLENLVGRSLPFWEHFYPRLQEVFPASLGDVSLEAFHRGINAVGPSLIRVEADEVTYGLHIVLRFELEKSLIAGDLEVEQLPEAWKQKADRLLGVSPPDDSRGVLQDIHWSMGAIGYFPTYALGNLYAAQFFDCFEKQNADWQAQLRQGQFTPLLGWLREQIHRHGRLYPAPELCRRVTGKRLEPTHFLDYLNRKFSEVYAL